MSNDTLTTEGQNTTGAEQQQAATTTEVQATTEGATTEVQTTESQQAAVGEQAKAIGAPEAYEAFTVPENYDQSSDMVGEFKGLAKELNLTQEQAQKLIELDVKRTQSSTEALQKASNEWAEAAKADAEFGGDKLDESLVSAKKALDAFGSPELKTLLNDSGLGNHPDVIRFMVRAGKAISEDGFVSGARGANSSGGAQRLYSNSNMNP
jgi:hypothetical protein